MGTGHKQERATQNTKLLALLPGMPPVLTLSVVPPLRQSVAFEEPICKGYLLAMPKTATNGGIRVTEATFLQPGIAVLFTIRAGACRRGVQPTLIGTGFR
jgi:hypothetical protein